MALKSQRGNRCKGSGTKSDTEYAHTDFLKW